MAEYRTLRMTFWNDPYVEELEPSGRLLYLYLITCPHTTNLGVLEVSVRRMAYETGLKEEEVKRLLAQAEAAGKVVRDGNVLWVVNFVKHQASTSPRLVQSLRALYSALSSEKIRAAVLRTYPPLFSGEGVDTVGAGCGEEKEEREKGRGRERFSPPSEEEVRAYCEERANGIDAGAFVDFYASRGWKAGRVPMKDWRAAVRTWEARQRSSLRPAAREERNERAIRRAVERFESAALFREEGR